MYPTGEGAWVGVAMTFSYSRSICMHFSRVWAWIGPMQVTNTSHSHILLHITDSSLKYITGRGIYTHTTRLHLHMYIKLHNITINTVMVNTPQVSHRGRYHTYKGRWVGVTYRRRWVGVICRERWVGECHQ